MKKEIRYLLAAVLVCFVLSGCAKKQNTDQSNSDELNGDMLIEASIGDASNLNPLLATDSSSSDINGLIFNGLVKYDKDLKLTGDLASSWEILDNGLVIVFHLRKGVKWHDGKEFTSQDVKFTYEKLIDPKVKTAFSSDFEKVKEIEIPDTWTVKVFYKEIFAPALASWGMSIIPKHLLEKGDFNKNVFNAHPIGTGPYVFEEWVQMEKIVLRANPDYFEGKPRIARYVYRIIPDLGVQFSELEKGTVDFMGLSVEQYKKDKNVLASKYKINVYRYPAINSYTYLGYNLLSPFFKDKRVRKAIAFAINKKEIVDAVLQGFGSPVTGPYPPTFWAYNKGVEDYNFDINKAKRLLAEAGWRDSDSDGIIDKNGVPFRFTVITNQGNKEREMCATIIQDKLSKIGIKADIRILEWSTFLHQYVDKKKFDAVLLGWSVTLDPDQYSIWHSSQIERGYNFISYKNDEVDKLLDEGRKTFDQDARKKIYNRFHKIIADDQPYCFLYVRDSLPAINSRFKGIQVAPIGISYNFIKWYVPRNERKYLQ